MDSKLGFFVLALGYPSKFFPIQEKDEKLDFLSIFKPRLHFQISPSSLRVKKLGFLKSQLFHFVRL